jgi:hypothetical protein
MQTWTSKPLPLPVDPQAPFKRVDLEFEGVEHTGESYVALVYLNNRRAGADTGRDPSQGFAAGFNVFAHGVCWGVDDEHCTVHGAVSPFDRRPEHRLTPQNVTLDITDAVETLGDVKRLQVTVVAEGTGEGTDLLRFSDLTLITYE